MEKEKLHVVVDRSRWLRGEGSMKSFLFRPTDGKMCCLGFACLANGDNESVISGARSPSAWWIESQALPGIKTNWGWNAYVEAMSINDAQDLRDAKREEMLTETLARVGIELTFVDGPVRP